MKIYLNNKEYKPEESLLPCLISYSEKTGGSHFSVSLLAELFLHGSKVLFLTAYPMATESFLEQVGGVSDNILQISSEDDLEKIKNQQAIMIKSGEQGLFIEALRAINDLSDRIVFLKNMEVFDDSTISECLKLDKLIFSGDIDKCHLKRSILEKRYSSTILFSQPETVIDYTLPTVEKYSGYLWSRNQEGIVSTETL